MTWGPACIFLHLWTWFPHLSPIALALNHPLQAILAITVDVQLLIHVHLLRSHRLPPGFSVHGILWARILERIAMFFSRRSSWLSVQTCISGIAGIFFTHWVTWKAQISSINLLIFPLEDEMVRKHHWLNDHEFKQTPGVGEGQGSLVCCSPWSRKELGTT